jgi:hypothetical protein
VNYQKAPFPWFGGKADAAPAVWAALGDVPHYVEPFAGSLAVLLRRPHPANRPYCSETVADIDALVTNFWRSVQLKPQEAAEAASYPVSELDKHARGCFLLKWRKSEATAHLAGDPTFCDPVVAGWWAWCVSCSIGAWGTGGPWWPDENGILRKRNREPGAKASLPHLGDNGRGVNRQTTREPGVKGDIPDLNKHGGVNSAQVREPGMVGSPPNPQDDVESAIASDYEETGGYHPMTMPEVRRWFAYLSARLRHVRIINGDWTGAINGSYERVLTSGATLTLSVRQGKGPCGVFLDPPYGVDDRDTSLYGDNDSLQVAARVREWCLEHGDDPRYRIVYAGFDQEGSALVAAGWREVEWFRDGLFKGGMGKQKRNKGDGPGHQQHRERLWLSPHCLQPETDARDQTALAL